MNQRTPLLFCLFLALLATGCAHTYRIDPISRKAPLRADASAVVSVPRDGSYQREVFEGSGRAIAQVVGAAFNRRLPRVAMMRDPAALEVCLAEARANQFDYLVVPLFTDWINREAEYGHPERVQLSLTAYDAQSGKPVAFANINAKCKWAALDGVDPEVLLATPVDISVNWFFSPAGTPAPNGKPDAQPDSPPSAGGE